MKRTHHGEGWREYEIPAAPPEAARMDDLPLFNPPTSPKEEAINRAETHASARWCENALRAVRVCANVHDEFTTDEVWDALRTAGKDDFVTERNPTAMGAIMLRAARLGWIRKSGRVRQSTQTTNHQRDVTIWTVVRRPQEEI